jgi:transposase-like protein
MRTPTNLSDPVYTDENAARSHLEALRWPDGVVCPRCGAMGKIAKLEGKSMGAGWWYCGDCQDKFTVRVGSIFERSHIPLHKWLLGFRLMASSKKGISAHQLHRTLGLTYKSAWFMAHRIREAMKDTSGEPMGGNGTPVEVDEAYLGSPGYTLKNTHDGAKWQPKRGHGDKMMVVTLVERGGRARSVKVNDMTADTVSAIIARNVRPDSRLMTDESRVYAGIGRTMDSHETVHHKKKEYARGDVTTNTVEGFFSVFKRGMKGVYQHCDERHLQRYLHEFDFRYSNRAALDIDDGERTALAIKGAEGKRLTYRRRHIRAGEQASDASPSVSGS